MNETDSKGIFVTNANKYQGFINVNSLLSLSHKRNLEIAKNQNPLSKLPGNNQIEEFIHKSFKLIKDDNTFHMLYFDFNDFKPFNDTYGFRQGDRAILIFTEILQKYLPLNSFIAHVGGDDFFVGFSCLKYEEVYEYALKIQKEFKLSVKNLYEKKDIENGYITCYDRFNVQRKFELLTVSCAIIEISLNSKKKNFDYILGIIKKKFKKINFPVGICI